MDEGVNVSSLSMIIKMILVFLSINGELGENQILGRSGNLPTEPTTVSTSRQSITSLYLDFQPITYLTK